MEKNMKKMYMHVQLNPYAVQQKLINIINHLDQ